MKYLYSLFALAVGHLFWQCGGTMRSYSPEVIVEADSLKRINDVEIQKAFEASPQLTLPVTLSFFNVGYHDDSFVDSLKTIEQIGNIFEISPNLVNPQATYKRRRGSIEYSFVTPTPINLRQLRLLSAQAKADLLVVCSISMDIEERTNSLAWSYLILVPVLFMPAFDVNVTIQADLLYIDVRNGLLYHSTTIKDERTKKHIHPFKTESHADRLAKAIVSDLIDEIVTTTKQVLSNERNFLKAQKKVE